MPVIESSKPSPSSETGTPAASRTWPAVAIVAVLASVLSAGAVWLTWRQGWTLYYGDAEAHLNIARRVVESRTAGYEQLGTSWLPMLHMLMMPLVRDDVMWRSGLAGAIPPALCFILGVTFF